jgi:hypothetical protein
MPAQTPIVNIHGDHEETILRLARHLATNKIRRKLFNVIYGRGSRPRSKKQIMQTANIAARHEQQVQNQLDHLAKHHLIVRGENDGSVRDGSRYLFRKDESVRANRQQIIRYADDRRAAEKVATKRRPLIRGISSIRTITKQALRKRRRLNVLYLTADPNKANSVRVDAEFGRVLEAIRGSKFRENINVEHRPAANLKTLLNGLNDHRPQIVHFSGHGDSAGITTDNASVGTRADEVVSFELLAKALRATDSRPKVIVLNSCSSSGARKALLPLGVIIISMRRPVSDIAAAAFAPLFYAAIAAGQSVKSAFEQGKVAVEMVSIGEVDTPELFHPAGTDPGNVTLT